jgi:UDP-2,3-diacylglucosamine pyrophosphatase LpxH
MSGRTVLLADAHLRPGPRPAQAERLRRLLLERARGAERLVLLGDTFNCWFERGGRHAGDYADALGLFAEAAEAGLRIHHVSGNRDFVVGPADPESAEAENPAWAGFFGDGPGRGRSALARHGVVPHGERYVFRQDGLRVLALHGDTYCRRDLPYRALRWSVQGPLGRLAGRIVPWTAADRIVRHLQTKSVEAKHRRPPAYRDIVTEAAAPDVAAGADLVVTGHTHYHDERPLRAGARSGRLVIVPPFVKGGWYGELAAGEVRILRVEPEIA